MVVIIIKDINKKEVVATVWQSTYVIYWYNKKYYFV